jgi:hypothetical protein
MCACSHVICEGAHINLRQAAPSIANMFKDLSIRARSLAIAACLAASVASLSIAPVMAQDNSPDPGVRCAAKIGPGQYEFYLPGERATDTAGNKWVCGPDGQWFRDYSALIRVPITKLATTSITTQQTATATLAR